MFTRNYWMYTAARFIGNTDLVYSKTQKPKYITWNGAVGADVYSGNAYTGAGYASPPDVYTMAGYCRYGYSDFGVKTVTGSYNPSINFGGYGLLFGSGNTPATIDDYKLSGDIITNCTSSYTTNSSISDDGSVGTFSRTYTITNNNDTEITIGEIGLYAEMCWQTAYSAYTCYPVLYERTALETPVTIPAGGVGQVTYTIQMNYPTA